MIMPINLDTVEELNACPLVPLIKDIPLNKYQISTCPSNNLAYDANSSRREYRFYYLPQHREHHKEILKPRNV